MHVDKYQSFYKLALSILMEVARHVQNTQNGKFVIFLQYLKNKKYLILPVEENKKLGIHKVIGDEFS